MERGMKILPNSKKVNFLIGCLQTFQMNIKQKCEELKNKGNEAFKKKDYKKAISFYTEAIEYEPTSILYCNRSSVYLAKQEFKEALSDAEEGIQLNKSWFKGYLRKAQALYGLKSFDLMFKIIQQGIAVEPNPQFLEFAEKIEKEMESILTPVGSSENVLVSGDPNHFFSQTKGLLEEWLEINHIDDEILPRNYKSLSEEEIIEVLKKNVEKLESKSTNHIDKKNIILFLGNLAYSEQFHFKLIDLNFVESISKLFEIDDGYTSVIIPAFSNFCSTSQGKRQIINVSQKKYQILDKLVSIVCSQKKYFLRDVAYKTLENLTQSEITDYFIKSPEYKIKGLLEYLVTSMKGNTLDMAIIGCSGIPKFIDEINNHELHYWKSDISLIKNLMSKLKDNYKILGVRAFHFLQALCSISLYRADLLISNNIVEFLISLIKTETNNTILDVSLLLLGNLSQNDSNRFLKIFVNEHQFTRKSIFKLVRNPETSSASCRLLIHCFEPQKQFIPKEEIEKLHDDIVANLLLANKFSTPFKLENASYVRHNVAVLTLCSMWKRTVDSDILETILELYFKVKPNIQVNITGLLCFLFRGDEVLATKYFHTLNQKNNNLTKKFLEALVKRSQEPVIDEMNDISNSKLLLYCLRSLMGIETDFKFNLNQIGTSASKTEKDWEKHFKPELPKKKNLSKFCDCCGKENAAKKCSKCNQAYYCDRDCQVKHWSFHKKSCK
jgi:hypothetical protein